ncbi:MAG TPA: hypothetical protein PKO36_08685 [Candidatus Hydrogenedentes bacterium]|nr:hypothetical protein [Candidatus Hydrogenedentota bacterium]
MISLVVLAGSCAMGAVDFADAAHREAWLHHPVVGDPSFDAFERYSHNPVYTGAPPYEWPVNGALFRDPKSGRWYAYVSLYPKGYWPAGPTRLLRSCDDGVSWEDRGLVITGDKDLFDGDGVSAGATCDASIAADERGYHAAYGWAKPDNSDGGIAYAFAESPEGPFVRDTKPIHAESAQPMLPPGYKRVYASSIVRRKRDWLILASMSTPRNAGGMWAFIGMTAPEARGPYSPPIVLRSPQQDAWAPQPVEFFPAFVHEDYVYAPLTSVAANRGYHVVYRAAIEEAHRPGAWRVWQDGSVFHAEANEWESHGIWGQAVAGFIGPDERLRILYPSRNSEGIGTINLAGRPWKKPYRNGFRLSAPNAPSLALLQRCFVEFELEITLDAVGPWRCIWAHRGPIGPDRAAADAELSSLCRRSMMELRLTALDWSLSAYADDGAAAVLANGKKAEGLSGTLALKQESNAVAIAWNGASLGRVELCAMPGGLALLAEKGTYLDVKRFSVSGGEIPGSWFLLPVEGLLGAGSQEKEWETIRGCRYGNGFASSREGARVKWNFIGRRVRVWAPRGPEYGEAEIRLDGASRGRVSFHDTESRESAVLWESGELDTGRHAIALICATGTMPVDSLEIVP